MGSCISKCKRKRKHQIEPSHVQDKLVISQAPPPPLPTYSSSFSSTKQPLSPRSPTSASSSVSSVSCTTRNTSSSCSLTSSLSSSSSISSIISSKERSFSNEFLYSCVKENPQIIRVDPVKGVVKKSVAVKNSHDSIQSRQFSSIPQKRARANSPVLSRQKSFRREIEIPNYTNSTPSRNLRSPSPSRRFGGDHNYRGELKNRHKEVCCKNSVVSKENVFNSGILSAKRENVRPPSPINNLGRNRGYLMSRENSIYGICSKIDEIAGGEDFSPKRDVDVIPMEDIDNPLIALDCFIFL